MSRPVSPPFLRLTARVLPSGLRYHKNTQVVVYSFVTAYARLDMLEDMRLLMSLGCLLFYTDTDSIIFLRPRSKARLVDELLSVGSLAYGKYKSETEAPLVSFVALSPKNYSHRDANGNVEVRTRGFTLTNAEALKVVNHSSMRRMLLDFLARETRVLDVRSMRLQNDRRHQTVSTTVVKKRYRNDIFDKRILQRDRCGPFVETVAFGAKHTRYADVGR